MNTPSNETRESQQWHAAKLIMRMVDSGLGRLEHPYGLDGDPGVMRINVTDAAKIGGEYVDELLFEQIAVAMTRREKCIACGENGEHNPLHGGWCNNCECHGDCVLVERVAIALYEHDREPGYEGSEWDWPNIDKSYDYEGDDPDPGPEWLRDIIRRQARVAISAMRAASSERAS